MADTGRMAARIQRTLACLVLSAAASWGAGCSPGSAEAYCDEAAAVAADNPAAVFAAWDPANPATSDQLTRATAQLHQLADVAPPEIADDAGLVASTADDLSGLLTDLRGDELDAALREREDEFAAVDEASLRLTAFTRSACGVDFSAPPPTTTAPSAGATTTSALP
jgi:hypothetical protein